MSSANRFYISVAVSAAFSRLAKRNIYYVAFSGDSGILVPAQSEAAPFELINGYLMTDGGFIGAESSTGYSIFEKFSSQSEHTRGWSFDGNSVGFGNSTFCEASDGTVYIVLTTSPFFACIGIAPVAVPGVSTLI
jgi:hypothetical protein